MTSPSIDRLIVQAATTKKERCYDIFVRYVYEVYRMYVVRPPKTWHKLLSTCECLSMPIFESQERGIMRVEFSRTPFFSLVFLPTAAVQIFRII